MRTGNEIDLEFRRAQLKHVRESGECKSIKNTEIVTHHDGIYENYHCPICWKLIKRIKVKCKILWNKWSIRFRRFRLLFHLEM